MSPNTPANAQDLITQLVQAASDETRLKRFLLANLAEAAVCSLAPRYDLDKTQAIQRISEIFAMASGGSVTLLASRQDGSSACGRLFLTKNKHDLKQTRTLNPRGEPMLELSIWIDQDYKGQIEQLAMIGDMLTPSLAMGFQMVPAS